MNIVFTGTAKVDGEHYDRERLTKTANLYGHTVSKYVDRYTSYLVVGDGYRKTQKKRDAFRYKTPTITVSQFLEMLFTNNVNL